MPNCTNCPNCNTPADALYCPNCGQKNIDLQRPLYELLKEVAYETFDLDGRALRTVVTLLRRPGVLTSEFLAGHRRRYTPPFRLYLVISLLFFFVATWLAGQGILLEQGQDPAALAAGQARFMSDELPRLMFVLMPVFALLLKIAFSNRFYLDHLIFSVHTHSAAYVVLGFMLPFEQLASQSPIALLIQVGLMLYLLFYFITAVHQVYRASWPVSAAKFGGVMLFYMAALSLTIETTSSLTILAD